MNSDRHKTHSFMSCTGGGIGIIFIGMMGVIIIFIVFFNIADYSMFAYKKDVISKSVDYAVCAAIQELNVSESILGLSQGYDEDGIISTKQVKIDTHRAMKVFIDTLKSNSGLSDESIMDSVIACTTYAHASGMNYELCVFNDTGQSKITTGYVDLPAQLEGVINVAAQDLRIGNAINGSLVYVNGNPNTNLFENGSYFLAYVKGVRIRGLKSDRYIDFAGFAGSKVYR